jgi:hypothetical protein
MKRRSARLAAALCLLFVVALLPTVATAAPVKTTLLSETVTKPHWRAYKLHSDGSNYTIKWLLPRANEPVNVGAWIFEKDSNFEDYLRSGFDYTAYVYQDAHHYDLNVAPGVGARDDVQRNVYDATTSITLGNMLPPTPDRPATYTLVLWWTGDVENGVQFEMSTDGGVRLGAMTTGTGVQLLSSKDFAAVANAGTQASIPRDPRFPNGFGGGARAIVGGSHKIDVTGTLIGRWGGAGVPGVSADAMLMTTPAGKTVACGCPWYKVGLASNGPGTYTFSQNGAGGGLSMFGDTFLLGIDVTLPICKPAQCFPETAPT